MEGAAGMPARGGSTMLYAVFSDVHGNREAFEAVLAFCRRQGVARHYFVGDIVGYGADPQHCIAMLRDLAAYSVVGNHDAAALDRVEAAYFNLAARKAVDWTAGRLSADDRRFLEELPLVHEEAFTLVHGTPARPEEFDYILSPYQAMKAFLALSGTLCFVGHSHRPGILVEEKDAIRFDGSVSLELDPERRYIVNVGSVGQPRDADPRACVCLFDEDKRTVTLHRVAYDVARAAEKIRSAGLPPVLAERLFEGR